MSIELPDVRNVLVTFSIYLLPMSMLVGNSLLPESLFPQLKIYITEALQAAPNIQRQRLHAAEARGGSQAAASARLPKLTANGRLALRAENRFGNEADFDRFSGIGDTNMFLHQPVYHFGGIEAQITQGRLREDIIHYDTEIVRRDLIHGIRYHYIRWLLEMLEFRSVDKHIDFSRRVLDAKKALLEQGGTSRQELLQSEIFLQEVVERSLALQRSINYERQALENLMGRSLPKDEPLPTDFPQFNPFHPSLDSTEGDIKRVMDTPESRRMQLRLEVEEAHYRELESQSLPRLDIVAGVYQDSVDDYRSLSNGGLEADSVPRMQSFFGLQFSWDIFDGFRKDGLKASSIARQQRLEIDLREQLQQHRRELDQLQTNLRHISQQIRARERRVNLEQERVRGLVELESDDILTQNSLLQARVDLAQAEVNLWHAQGEYLLQYSIFADRFLVTDQKESR